MMMMICGFESSDDLKGTKTQGYFVSKRVWFESSDNLKSYKTI
jgi:hypothetical protein